MYKRVLVPLDGSAFGDHAIPFALQIAGRTAATVELVHIHVPQDDGLSDLTPYRFQNVTSHYAEWEYDELRHELDGIRERARLLSDETGLIVRGRVLSGAVSSALAAEAKAYRADIIVMATHGRTGLQRVRFGSVADLVVRHAKVPVLLVRPVEGTQSPPLPVYRRILVLLDGSPFSEEVLQPAAEFASLQNADIVLVHVAKQRGGLGNEYLERVMSRSTGLGANTQLETVKAERVTDGVLEVADRWRADLIALTTHGRGGLARLLVGSTASDLLAHTHVPVLLRRPEALVTSSFAPAVAQLHEA